MFVRDGPSSIFILQYRIVGSHLDGAVATDGAAGAWASVFGRIPARGRDAARHRNAEPDEGKQNATGDRCVQIADIFCHWRKASNIPALYARKSSGFVILSWRSNFLSAPSWVLAVLELSPLAIPIYKLSIIKPQGGRSPSNPLTIQRDSLSQTIGASYN